MTAPHRFRSHLRVAAMLCLLVAVPLLVPGCALYSDMKSATRDMDFSLSDPDTHLRKKIVFSAFENRSPFRQEDLLALFENTVRTAMAKDCPRALFLGPDNPGLPAALRRRGCSLRPLSETPYPGGEKGDFLSNPLPGK